MSVVLPNYNGAHSGYLRLAVNSILEQVCVAVNSILEQVCVAVNSILEQVWVCAYETPMQLIDILSILLLV